MRRSGFEPYGIRELQLKSLGLLVAIDKVCREHGLTYYMIAGTLLGAVRHKGFIPWDDDIDVGMPRRDYDILMEHASEWFDDRFRMVSFATDNSYSRYFAKLEDCNTTVVERFHLERIGGLYMDIFPLDNVPDGKMARYFHYRRFHRLNKQLYFAYRDPYKHGHGVGPRLMAAYQKTLSREGLRSRITALAAQYSDVTCSSCTTHDGKHEIFPYEIMGKPAEYEFEGHMFYGPADYDSFLKIMYGPDYMSPPPAHVQVSHLFEYVDFDTPYSQVSFDELKSEFLKLKEKSNG